MDAFEDKSQVSLRGFTVLVIVAQILGLSSVILIAVYNGHFRGGYAWQSDPAHEYNYHPLFMIIGMIFLYGDAILAYRVFRNEKKIYIKILHAGVHLSALIFASVGLKAVFDSHNLNKPPNANLYTLHSWVGLITVILFGLQWVFGFVSFLFPKLSAGLRRYYMRHHLFWGLVILGLAGSTALMGLLERAIFDWGVAKQPLFNYPAKETMGIYTNCMGLVIIAFVIVVSYTVTREEYKRQPSPDEEHIPLHD